MGSVNTPRTQAAYGLIGGASHDLGDASFAVKTRYAMIALSSLTDDPIRASRSLLLTAVGRAENTGAAYNVLHTARKVLGSAPILLEPIEATVSIRCAAKLRVRPIRNDGSAGTDLATTYSEGRLTFNIGAADAAWHYRIEE